MLNLLIGWKEWTTEISGHKISMELYPLSNEAMTVVSPLMARDINKKDKVALYLETFEMQKLAATVLPAHARNLSGIAINGKTPTWEQVAKEAVLAELAVTILGQLFIVTSIKETEEKN